MTRWFKLAGFERPRQQGRGPLATPGVPATELRLVAAEQDWPRLRVTKGRITPTWVWRVLTPAGTWIDSGQALTHAQALAIGLAALEHATVAGSR